MNLRYHQIGYGLLLLGIYSILSYFIVTNNQKLDFSSFYSTGQALLHGENPYKNLTTTYLATNVQLPANLNPPIVLWLFKPWGLMSYSAAKVFWFVCSLILGVLGAVITFHYAFSAKFLHKNYVNLFFIYFAFFATLINVATLQLGTLLFFLIMLGYHFYLSNRNYVAGVLWGIIIAMKFFPALLFFYVLKQRRFKVFGVMLITFFIACLIPLLVYGTVIYEHYFSMMSHVLWYGDDWNASIYGFIVRMFMWRDSLDQIVYLEIVYLILFCILLLGYLKKLGPTESNPINHQPFCLTLVMMVLMSPLGWVYYFPVLIFPLILTLFDVLNKKNNVAAPKKIFIWLVCFFLISIPLDYVKNQDMSHVLGRLTLFSCYFYGLVLLTYLLIKTKKIYGNTELHCDEATHYFIPGLIILIFGASVPTLCFILRLFNLNLSVSFS